MFVSISPDVFILFVSTSVCFTSKHLLLHNSPCPSVCLFLINHTQIKFKKGIVNITGEAFVLITVCISDLLYWVLTHTCDNKNPLTTHVLEVMTHCYTCAKTHQTKCCVPFYFFSPVDFISSVVNKLRWHRLVIVSWVTWLLTNSVVTSKCILL